METKEKSKFKILIVDDTAELLDITRRILVKAGYHVLTAATGAECEEVLEKTIPDIILLDIVLPDTDGRELCKKIKIEERFSSIYLILLSSIQKSSDSISQGLEGGADGYLLRPVPERELLARLEAACRIVDAERKLRESVDELSRFNNLLVDREIRMIELKKEINDLLAKSGKDPKYTIPK